MVSKTSVCALAFAAPLALLTGAAAAQSIDGSRNLICFAIDTVHCGADGVCNQGRAADLDLPQFFRVDFTAMTVSRKTGEDTERASKIVSVNKEESDIVLQGVEDGLGWSVLIEPDGNMTISASRAGEAFVVFGACTTE